MKPARMPSTASVREFCPTARPHSPATSAIELAKAKPGGISSNRLNAAKMVSSSTPMAQVQPIDGVISGQCHSDMVRGALGLAASDATVARARVDSDSLHVRVLRHDGPRVPPASEGGDRLTIEKGRTNNITAIYCG
ncbi:hypothetical protein G6F24_015080 [Rhizopus arrhizus]|nr:hypothetical protein G6F24_015080 [Rhizopus arrhizus]